jgi:hypothetical protein
MQRAENVASSPDRNPETGGFDRGGELMELNMKTLSINELQKEEDEGSEEN